MDNASQLEPQFERLRLQLERAVAQSEGRFDEAEAADREITRLRGKQGKRAKGADGGIETLRERFNLSDEEIDIILHALWAAIDPSVERLRARLMGTSYYPWFDVQAALRIHRPSLSARLNGWALFQPDAPLIRNRLLLLDRGRPEAQKSLLHCEIRVPGRVARLILGSDPAGGRRFAAELISPDTKLESVMLADEVRSDLLPFLKAPASEKGPGQVLLFAGPAGTGKTMLAQAVATSREEPLLVVDPIRLLEAGRSLDAELDELFLEATLQKAVVLFERAEMLFSGRTPGGELSLLLRNIDSFPGLIILTTRQPTQLDAALDRRILLRILVDTPSPALREKIWQAQLTSAYGADIDVAALGKRYEFAGGSIRSAAQLALARARTRGEGAKVTMADCNAAAQAQLRGDLSGFTERTRAVLSMDMLVLPKDEKDQIWEIIHAGRNRGRVLYEWGFSDKLPTGKGLVVLLSGDPGTGKTLAAEIIAAELGLNLYRINPAKVVSKYVGETERNLNEILSQAKSTHAVLFFDEADALFATRVSKVESSNDRFANLETNFLLQQLERYEGIVILATNLETSIDQAFKRRIAYHIELPFPTAEDRESIWRTLMPKAAPQGEIDFALLAREFDLSGGHIKNALLRAAYFAAQRNVPIDQTLLAEAAEREAHAAGKLVHRVTR